MSDKDKEKEKENEKDKEKTDKKGGAKQETAEQKAKK